MDPRPTLGVFDSPVLVPRREVGVQRNHSMALRLSCLPDLQALDVGFRVLRKVPVLSLSFPNHTIPFEDLNDPLCLDLGPFFRVSPSFTPKISRLWYSFLYNTLSSNTSDTDQGRVRRRKVYRSTPCLFHPDRERASDKSRIDKRLHSILCLWWYNIYYMEIVIYIGDVCLNIIITLLRSECGVS